MNVSETVLSKEPPTHPTFQRGENNHHDYSRKTFGFIHFKS